jgi:hypothetical protein
MMASSLALQTLMNALVATAAKMAAEQERRAFEAGLAEMRAEYVFAAPVESPIESQFMQAIGVA